MPEKTLNAVADHGNIKRDTVTGYGEQAAETFELLSGVGIDVTDVFLTLEREGVEKFDASWNDLLKSVEDQLGKAKG
jgi:transaldolase